MVSVDPLEDVEPDVVDGLKIALEALGVVVHLLQDGDHPAQPRERVKTLDEVGAADEVATLGEPPAGAHEIEMKAKPGVRFVEHDGRVGRPGV